MIGGRKERERCGSTGSLEEMWEKKREKMERSGEEEKLLKRSRKEEKVYRKRDGRGEGDRGGVVESDGGQI